jgi:HD-like signal output (HDOD) protein
MPKSNAASATLRQRLIKALEHPSYRPPSLPSTIAELVTLSNNEDTGVDDVVRLLERDQMLAGSVLRLVSSPLYTGRGPVRSLGEAVVRLGVRTVRDAVFAAAMRRGLFQLPEFADTIERIGRHGIATAYLARAVCRVTRQGEDEAFLSALMHDIGFAAILFAFAQGKIPGNPTLEELWTDMDSMHEQSSKLITKFWRLPLEVTLVVGNHHQLHTGDTARVAAAVTIADALTPRLDAEILGPSGTEGVHQPADAVSTEAFGDAVTLLSLDDATLERIVDEGKASLAVALG